MGLIKLKKFENQDLKKIKEWYTQKTEWKLWDAPWEEVKYDEEIQRAYRKQRTDNFPCFEYEIVFDKNHVGWISAYYMTDDFKYNGLKKTNNIAIGIDIPDESMRGKGIGVEAIKEYLKYFKNLGYSKIYTQTWSGNTRMIHVAEKVGFEEVNRFKGSRIVNGKKYDALTFLINL
ncbi:MAG: GNAT family N-acetyltransferase [Clostridia bacterium]|nr:GNAT family N-acetyltransferase [Clostridia bacterium]